MGIKPPLLLVGTEEANRIATEVQNEMIREKMNDFLRISSMLSRLRK